MHRSDWMMWPKEAQRREEKRAEARLAEGLQRLDEAKHYHLNTLSREQRTLHRHLLAIKTGNRWRGLHAMGSRPTIRDLSHPAVSFQKTLLPIIPPTGRDLDRSRPAKPQSSCSLQARVQEFISSGENRADNTTAPLCLPELKLQPTNTLSPAAPERENRERDTQRNRVREGQSSMWERPKDSQKGREQVMVLKKAEKDSEKPEEIDETTPPSSPISETLCADGRLRTVHVLPNFAQALAEARKARYIRYRGRPPQERELSIKEIFPKNSREKFSKH